MDQHLLNLPDEIKLKIMAYLDGVSKLTFMNVCKDFARFSNDYECVRYMDFSFNFDTKIRKLCFLSAKPRAHLITHLNINGVYWIPSATLRSVLVKFVNLTSLHVIDTDLKFKDLQTVLNTIQKIKKLSLYLKNDSCGDVYNAVIKSPLTYLYVVYSSFQFRVFLEFLSKFQTLNELWMVEPNVGIPKQFNVARIIYRLEGSTLLNVKNRVVLKNCQYELYKNQDFSLVLGIKPENTVIETIPGETVFEVLEEQPAIVKQSEGSTIPSLVDNLAVKLNLNRNKHFTVKNVKQMIRKNTYDVSYDGLNLCDTEYNKEAMEQFLFLDNTKPLRQLYCNSVIFWGKPQIKSQNKNLFKKTRLGVQFPEVNEKILFSRFVNHTPDMRDFSISDTNIYVQQVKVWNMSSLEMAKNWKCLQCLIMESINFTNGKFLKEITKSCQLLQVLKIKDLSYSPAFNKDMIEALPNAASLKDFRFECKGVLHLNDIARALSKCPKLQRVYIQAITAPTDPPAHFKTMLVNCKKMSFLYLSIQDFTLKQAEIIRKYIMRGVGKRELIVHVRGSENDPYTNALYRDIPCKTVEDLIMHPKYFHMEFLNSFFNTISF